MLSFLVRHSNLLQPILRLSLLSVILLCGCPSPRPSPKSSVTDLNARSANPLRTAQSQPVVLLFVRTDCPVSNRYAPEMERLYRAYAPRHISFWLIYPDADTSTADIVK